MTEENKEQNTEMDNSYPKLNMTYELTIINFEDNDNGKRLYKFYKNLDPETKMDIDKIINPIVQMETIQKLAEPGLYDLMKKLPPSQMEKFRKMGIFERIKMLQLLQKQIKEPQKALKIKIPDNTVVDDSPPLREQRIPVTPDGPPPPQQRIPVTPDGPPPPQMQEVNQEIFEKDIDQLEQEALKEEISKSSKISNQDRFKKLIEIYYQSNPYILGALSNDELEVRFGTRGIRALTKIDYDNVIKFLKWHKYYSDNVEGEYRLTIQNEHINQITGKFEISNVRTEIYGMAAIQHYCKTNDIYELEKSFENNVKFVKKSPFIVNNQKIFPVNFDDFNFRVSLQNESVVKDQISRYIKKSWRKSKKTFRLINRVTFKHPDFPVMVDLSITKSSDRIGRQMKTYYTIQEADVFNKDEVYEIELEVYNSGIGPGTNFNNANSILESLRGVIKHVLCGLQSTNYPISYPEQKTVLDSYMRLIHKEAYDPSKRIKDNNFIGPNSYVLKMKNICEINESSNIPNIRKDFVVTEKADGERHLIYISGEGKIYLINTNMNVIFTGAKTKNKDTFNSLLDGELIIHDKFGKYINLYAAFDIYYFNNFDVRSYTFMLEEGEKDIYKSRYMILKNIISILNPVSIIEGSGKQIQSNLNKTNVTSDNKVRCPIRIECKNFYPTNLKNGNIFDACRQILEKEQENRFEYNTDGLIFTHAFYGVASDKIGVAGPLTKTTWNYSFKWKPPQFNTVDFLVTTVKGTNNETLINSLFEDGINNMQSTQFNQYITLDLRCTFVPRLHGFINPCQDIIDDNIPEFKSFDEKSYNDAIPMKFYPTESFGDMTPGSTNIMLKMDETGNLRMFTHENQIIEDNTIVECSYDINGLQGWRWKPLRVRYDKTAQFKKGDKQFGNAYHVADDIWDSIYNRITTEMISTGEGIPSEIVNSDIYYNESSGKNFKTQSMKDFHNLYVKKKLIMSISKQGDTLIDFACGKGGDLPKWASAKLSFVFGVDKSKTNLENKLNGACARYLNLKKQVKNVPNALFVNGNSAYNIKNGSAMLDDKAIQITNAVFGIGPKDENKLGKGVAKLYGKGDDGFNISSCQFALHYFFENPDMLQGFVRNVAECTKLNGYFIGTAYDGKSVFNMLKNKKPGDGIQIMDDGKKIWEIIKEYNSGNFADNSSSIGYKISVFQESINQLIPEYLINFDYFDRVMENYGFKLVERNDAQEMGLPEGSGMFSEMYMNMIDEIKRNKYKATEYGTAPNMSSFEKKISFLNRYFAYKKVIEVDIGKVYLDLSDYSETEMQRNYQETKNAVEVAKKEVQKEKPRVRKLEKKLLLIPATEASEIEKETTKQIPSEIKNLKNKVKKGNQEKAKKLIIIESDDENDDN
jgi:hypothetical protein